ncbi:MAG TPA: CocE/NonD family hydrolase [Chloroflexota bacterium]|nr:CocE/NonD family hydrolase [Chloroflexota bacterium]
MPQTTIDFNVRVPMRDGVTLSADVYRPIERGRYPVLLTRTPYVKANERMVEEGIAWAEQGYVFMAMDVRGRGDSDGEFVPYRNDGIDGHDAIEWAAAQPWSNGNVGTTGGSYLGRIQWLTALTRPPHLKAMCVMVTPSDPFVEFPTGVPEPMGVCWHHMTSARTMHPTKGVDWMEVYKHLPLRTMDEAAGQLMPNWREEMDHVGLDEWWRDICYQDRFDCVTVPVLHISGWYDDEQIGTPLNFRRMVEQGGTPEARAGQKLLMGPWPHAVNSTTRLGEVEFGPDARIDMRGTQQRFFDHWLKGEANGLEAEAPVRIFVMGENVWRDEREWPLARTRFTSYYLHSGGQANSRFGDGRLSTRPPDEEPPDRYTYDPARPVPFLTEPVSSQIGGPDDYAAVQRRDDVLVYVTEPLVEHTEVTGPVRLQLYASSSATDTDFMAMLLDVHPSGFAQRLTDSMVRARFRQGMDRQEPLESGRVECYDIDLWNTAQVFKAGHRIGLQITSSAFPKYDRNLNTGGSLTDGTEMRRADQAIYHDGQHPSRLILPIIPGEDLS